MKKAKYGKMRQVTAVNAVNGSKTEGFLLPWFSPIIYHIAAFPATAQEERRDASPLSLVLLLLHVPVQECHDLASRAGVVRTERVRAGAVCNLRVVVHCPQHSIREILACRYIFERIAAACCRLVCCSPKERDHMCSRARRFRRERRGSGAIGNVVFIRPQHCLVVVSTFLYIREGIARALRLGTALGSPEEGHDLTACAGSFRTEGVRTSAVRDLRLMVYRPQHRIIVVCTLLHIHKRIRRCARRQLRNAFRTGFTANCAGIGLNSFCRLCRFLGNLSAIPFMS